jgi:hypothetical protein
MNRDLITPQNYVIDPDDRFSGGYSSIPIQGNITPQMYLEFAVQDFEANQGIRSNVNAFSNAKRAIHFQTDIVSKAFGIGSLPEKQRNSFPLKIDFCEKCGIAGRRILNKFNRIRNIMEHEYYDPRDEEVENMIDIASLFLAATARFITLFPSDMEVKLEPLQDLRIPSLAGIQLPVNEGEIYLFPDAKEADKETIDGGNLLQWQKDNSISLKAIEGGPYFDWVTFLVAHTL